VLSQNPDASEERLIGLPLDLSSIKSVMQAVEELKAKENKVDLMSRSQRCNPVVE
jgi:hypothetical protein